MTEEPSERDEYQEWADAELLKDIAAHPEWFHRYPTTTMILTINIYDDNDSPIAVTGEYTPGCKGTRDDYGLPMDPGSEPTMTILDASGPAGSRELTPDETECATSALWAEVIGCD